MAIAQRITVRNPPNVVDPEHPAEEGYTMWGTVPLPRGTDPNTIGNNFAALGYAAFQQHRKLAQTRNWDVYEWFVYNPGTLGRSVDTNRNETVDVVFLSDTYKRPPQIGKGNERLRRSDPTLPPGRPPGDINSGGAVAPLFDRMVSNLDWLGAVRLDIVGLANNDSADITESVYLTDNLNKIVRSGDCCVTKGKHVNTVHFGSFHIYWTVLRGRMDYQLVIHWHNGIPRSDVLVKSIRLTIKGTHESNGSEDRWVPPIMDYGGQFTGTWNVWSEWQDPAVASEFTPTRFNYYILKPHPEGKYWPFPRRARRSWRFALSPTRSGTNFGVKPQVYPGWGVGVWTGGGFLADNGRVWPTMFDHIKDGAGRRTAPDIVTSWTATLEGELANMVNSDNLSSSTPPVSQNQVHLPGTGQQYGGPTGAGDKYRPYAGIKALGANERAGLVEHSLLMMRHYARDWTALYEPSGDVVDPIAHCTQVPDGSGGIIYRADWQMNGQALFSGVTTNDGFYGAWKDTGFGFSSFNNRRIRTLGTAGTLRERVVAQWSMNGSSSTQRLQTYRGNDSAGLVNGQGWDNWDVQHRGVGWGHCGALYWLTGDDLARMYIIGEAEIANMYYWHGDGPAAGGIPLATQPGLTTQVGRDMGWSMAAIARAALIVTTSAVDSEDTTNANSSRGDRWMTGPLRRFVCNTEMGQTPAGLAWHTGTDTTSKPFVTPPFNSQWYVHQSFEMDYVTHGLQWARDAAPSAEWFRSTRRGSTFPVDPDQLMRDYLRGVEALWTVEACSLASIAVLNGGSGYTTGQVVYLASDRDRFGYSNPAPTVDVACTVTAVAGVVTDLAITTPGIYSAQPYEGNDALGFGAIMYAKTQDVNSTSGISLINRGVGYRANTTYKVVGGRPLGGRDNWWMKVQILTVDPATGGILTHKVVRQGRYEQPPVNAVLVWDGRPEDDPLASGATFTVPLSASGVGLRVNPTWSAPFKSTYAGSIWKIAPLRRYPSGSSWGHRDEWTGVGDLPPRDICLRPGVTDNGPGNDPRVGGAAQELNDPGHQPALAHCVWAGAPNAPERIADYFRVNASPPDLNAVRTILKNRGFGQLRPAQGVAMIDFWWPLYSALGPG